MSKMRFGFGLPIAISIVVGIGWIVFFLWHTVFWSTDYTLFQNIVIAAGTLLVAGALVGLTWMVWGRSMSWATQEGTIEYSMVIKASAEKVFAFYVDPTYMEKTAPPKTGLKVERTSEDPLRIGSTWRLEGIIAGWPLDLVGVYVEFEENRRLAWRYRLKGDTGTMMPRRLEALTFNATDGGTRVTRTEEYGFPGPGEEALTRFIRAIDEKAKEILEEE